MKTTKNYFPQCIHGDVAQFRPKDTGKISLYMDRVTPRLKKKKRHWLRESHKIVVGQHALDWAKCIKQIYIGSPGSDPSEYSECRVYSYTAQK